MLPQLREAHASPPDARQTELGDLRFRNLLPRDDWAALPAAIRHRFSKRVAGGATVIYAGEVVATELTFAGWVAAQLARLVGSPLPRWRDAHVPAVVSVTEDVRSGGQIWTRVYARKGGFPQVDPFGQALRRHDRSRRTCEPRRRHGVDRAPGERRTRLPQRALFLPHRARAPDIARVVHARCARRHAYGRGRGTVQLPA